MIAAPPEPPLPDELEALIREARTRQRRRWMIGTSSVVVLAGAVLATSAIVSGGKPSVSRGTGRPFAAVKTGRACGVRVVGMRVVDAGGRTLYREPGNWTATYPHPSVVRCSGSTAWVVWDNGAASSQEGYVGATSTDAGRSWKTVFAERYFGVSAPHELDAYLGPWTLHGPSTAYFTGQCPACGWGTVSLWVTKDGGRTFRHYRVTGLTGYAPTGIRVMDGAVTIWSKRFTRAAKPHKTVTIHVA